MRARLLLALLGACGLVLVAAPGAWAHDDLLTTIPADSYSVTQMPSSARFTFAVETPASDVTVRSGDRTLPVSAVPGRPDEVEVDLAGVPATETIPLAWRAIDAHDGHVTSGVVSFHVLDYTVAAAPSGTPAAGPPLPLHSLSVATHVVGYLAMAVLLGGLFFVSVLWPAGAADRRTRALLGGATVLGSLASLAAIYVTIRQVAPLSFAEAIAQHFGRVSVAVALLWLLAGVLVVAVLQSPEVVRRTAWRFSAVVVGGGLIRAVGMNAHGTQGAHPTLGLVIDFLHLTAVSAWVGGLMVMSVGLLPRRRLDELAEVVPRFSKVAATSVGLVIVSGGLLAWQLIGSVHGLFATHFGQVLIAKLVLVGFVLLAALASKRWVSRSLATAVAQERSSPVGSFVASVGTETVLVLAVLGAAGVLVTSSPGL